MKILEALQFVFLMSLMPFGYCFGAIVSVYRKAKVFNSKQQAFWVFVIMLLFVLLFYFFVDKNIDAKYLQTAFLCAYPSLDGDCINGFQFPLLYYVTMPFYFVFKEFAFLLLPLLLYFGSIGIICSLFKRFNLNQLWIPIFFSAGFFSINFLGFYTRNNLDFFLASVFAYYFFTSLCEQKNYCLRLLVISFLMMFSTPNALMFFILTILFCVKANFNVINFLFVPITNVFAQYKHFVAKVNGLFLPSLRIAFLPFANYINLLSLVLCLWFKDRLLFLIFGMNYFVSIVSVLMVPADPDPQQLAIRYGFVFVPLQIFLIAKILKEGGNSNEQRTGRKNKGNSKRSKR